MSEEYEKELKKMRKSSVINCCLNLKRENDKLTKDIGKITEKLQEENINLVEKYNELESKYNDLLLNGNETDGKKEYLRKKIEICKKQNNEKMVKLYTEKLKKLN
jgi:hypothetical protein